MTKEQVLEKLKFAADIDSIMQNTGALL